MKKIIVILLTTLSFVFYLYWDCFANDNAYVFVLKIEGSVTLQDSGEKIREMELLYPGMSLVIEKGASLSLTCAGCTILHLNHKNSPYTVKMSDFKQNQSIMAEMIKHFKAALEHFVRPGSKKGRKAEMRVRGSSYLEKGDLCGGLWPPNREDILPVGENLTFKWNLEGTSFSVKIKELDKEAIIYSKDVSSRSINIPVENFKQGREYRWSLLSKETDKKCEATFYLLGEDESRKIKRTLKDIASLLPEETDKETIYRLQAGYLLSEGLTYDAWQWLKIHGI